MLPTCNVDCETRCYLSGSQGSVGLHLPLSLSSPRFLFRAIALSSTSIVSPKVAQSRNRVCHDLSSVTPMHASTRSLVLDPRAVQCNPLSTIILPAHRCTVHASTAQPPPTPTCARTWCSPYSATPALITLVHGRRPAFYRARGHPIVHPISLRAAALLGPFLMHTYTHTFIDTQRCSMYA